MKVAELREALEGLAPEMPVVVYRENSRGTFFYDIAYASDSEGEPRRDEDGRVGFTFYAGGPARWLFISIEEPR
jgi:hypothetical protein